MTFLCGSKFSHWVVLTTVLILVVMCVEKIESFPLTDEAKAAQLGEANQKLKSPFLLRAHRLDPEQPDESFRQVAGRNFDPSLHAAING